MTNLKKLNQEDLEDITEFLSTTANNFIFKNVKSKEVIDLDINIDLSYDDELNVKIAVDLDFDKFSNASSNLADETIDYTLNKLDEYLNKNYYN
ncbi:MAG: DUF3194 domain-containing protein [Methanobrevibacter sp.]|nr:DUF3194 domain-containing protein [Candidatus Methanoflexus mossambicus]